MTERDKSQIQATGGMAKPSKEIKPAPSGPLPRPKPANVEIPPAPKPHSRAFDTLVEDEEDVVGLLAYALYKHSVREAAIAGTFTEIKARDLPQGTVQAFRSSAEQLVTLVVSDAIEKATPDIQNAATVARIDSHHSDIVAALSRERETIVAHVTTRTAFLSAFFTNVLAWVVSLLIAVLILNLANQPSTEEVILEKITPGAAADKKDK